MASNGKMAKITIPVSVNLGPELFAYQKFSGSRGDICSFSFEEMHTCWKRLQQNFTHLTFLSPLVLQRFHIFWTWNAHRWSLSAFRRPLQDSQFCIGVDRFVQLQEQNESQSAFEKQCKSVFVPSPRCLSLIWMPLRLRSNTYWLLRHVFSS